MRVPRTAPLATILAIAFLSLVGAGCSGNNNSNPVTSTTSISSTVPGSRSSSGVGITSLTGPPSPVPCNAPTSFDLHFEAAHAKSVELRINGGPVFATYTGGRHTEEVPLACDGSPQTYQLTARAANGERATKSLKLETRVSM